MLIDPVLDKLTCGICLDIANIPRQCSNGHLFCLTCVRQWLMKKKICPTCKVDLIETNLNRNLIAEISIENYIVSCHKRQREDNVCVWFGPANTKQFHTCVFGENNFSLMGRQVLQFSDPIQLNIIGVIVQFCR
jgi:hypothetical protein